MQNGASPTARQVFAATGLLKHADALAALIQDVRLAEDIEAVHKMRVASRRLRNAMVLFEPYLPSGKLKKWRKRTARVTRALRDARDADVQIDFVEGFIRSLLDEHRQRYQLGMKRLLLRLRQHRERVQPEVIAAMDRLESTGLIESMCKSLRAILAEGRTAAATLDYCDMVEEAAAAIIHRIEQVWVYTPYISEPKYVEQLHQMRIEVKHLRYTLESYAKLFSHELKPQIKLAKAVQTTLGDIHDCDMWVDFLPAFLVQERARFTAFYGHSRGFRRVQEGIRFLLEDRQRRRKDLHRQFVEQWNRSLASGAWETFRRSITHIPAGRG